MLFTPASFVDLGYVRFYDDSPGVKKAIVRVLLYRVGRESHPTLKYEGLSKPLGE